MSTQKAKFQLFNRLQNLGFTYEEAVSLRRIEITLQRWGELECGDDNGRCIERDETTGKPFMTYERGTSGQRGRYAIADREAGAIKRLCKIVEARNSRAAQLHVANGGSLGDKTPGFVTAYHQGDCRGCNLYLLTREQLTGHNGEQLPIDQYYTRGLAVCA